MAIIGCGECGHKISDQAATCPNCGAPIATAKANAKPRGRRIIFGVLVTVAALWLIGSTLWLIRLGMHRQLIGAANLFIQAAEQFPTADQLPGGKSSPPPRTVYQTTAQQLYQDYNTNGVATQSRIGKGGIRVRGTVAAIEMDSSGYPVVKLSTNNPNSADMTLTEDQTSAAAQLSRGQTVDIQCDRMHGIMGSPVGSQCTLLVVNAPSAAPSPGAASASTGGPAHAAATGVVHPSSAAAQHGSRQPRAQATIAVAEPEAVPFVSAGVPLPLSTPETTLATPPPLAAPEGVPSTAALPAPGAADGSPESAPATTAARVPNSDATAGPGTSAGPTPPATVTASDDLATVRATDPGAADHIASYCAASVAAGNGAASAAGCRRDEKDAWARLVLHNEFPALDDVARRTCNEPPFPDSYTAKEACARYELNITTSTSAQR
jgi:hypothetical protein